MLVFNVEISLLTVILTFDADAPIKLIEAPSNHIGECIATSS